MSRRKDNNHQQDGDENRLELHRTSEMLLGASIAVLGISIVMKLI